MRYKIVKGKVEESIFINAPYDTRKDALEDIAKGVYNNTEHTYEYQKADELCTCGCEEGY